MLVLLEQTQVETSTNHRMFGVKVVLSLDSLRSFCPLLAQKIVEILAERGGRINWEGRGSRGGWTVPLYSLIK